MDVEFIHHMALGLSLGNLSTNFDR